jgi:carboxyl-terminal processing protease
MKKIEKDEIVENNTNIEAKNSIKKPRRNKTKVISNTNNNEPIRLDDDTITRNYDFNLLEVVIIVLITGIVVSIASGLIIYSNYDRLFKDKPSYSGGETLDKEQKDVFEENYNKILNEYVNEVDKDELLNAAIQGMYNYLGDNYSTYLDADDTQSLNEQLEGKYTGIGVEIYSFLNIETNEYEIYISRVFKDTPAEEAGIKVDDKLLELNGISLKDKDAAYVSSTIKNSDKATHSLKVLRGEEELTLTLTRKQVFIDSVTSEVKDGVGYVKIETFSATAADQVKKHLDGFDESVKSLVIDLRDNTGGYLTAAYDLSDLFIEKGKNIYQTKNRENKVESFPAVSGVYRKFDKIAVIINENSASASEIMALALKESANAVVVGTKSFGKGTMQETKPLESGGMIKITTAYWLSPNGNSINLNGITPDIEVKDIDKQVEEAIKAVK